MDDEPLVLTSALRHGVPEADILHAYRNATFEFADDTGLTTVYMYTGPVRSGVAVLELGAVWWHGVIAIIHAMRARRMFTREGNRP
ncbi:MAG: hypothetical protein LBG60_16260 [Bifidobacteriaceae bacterium]|nr:hypothetical protein [Bifidobacteriaceae bacterium]